MNALTEKEILQCLGLTFTYSADEDGGVVIRKQLAALKEAILKIWQKISKQMLITVVAVPKAMKTATNDLIKCGYIMVALSKYCLNVVLYYTRFSI